jgi:hypothetical protein
LEIATPPAEARNDRKWRGYGIRVIVVSVKYFEDRFD